MEARKIATIVVNVLAGFIVVRVGLGMLPFPLNKIWGLFNVWLWIVPPTAIFWAKKKEDEKGNLRRLSLEPKVKVMIPMYQPLEVSRCKKC